MPDTTLADAAERTDDGAEGGSGLERVGLDLLRAVEDVAVIGHGASAEHVADGRAHAGLIGARCDYEGLTAVAISRAVQP
jgi:hypothetical protein